MPETNSPNFTLGISNTGSGEQLNGWDGWRGSPIFGFDKFSNGDTLLAGNYLGSSFSLEGTNGNVSLSSFDDGDGEIIIDSKHPNFKKILDTIPNESDYYYGTFDPISKNIFEEKIEVNFQNGFKLMIIELDIN